MTSIEFYQYMIHFAVMATIMMTVAVYLLVSKRNAFGHELIVDQRLRRRAGWMILACTLSYLANIPLVLWLEDNMQLLQMISLTIDMTICFPIELRFMIALLQDRQGGSNRIWWFSGIALMPLTGWLLTGQTWCMWTVYALYMTAVTAFIAWYIRATMAYRRFLADNYADLERKEIVWSWIVLAFMVFSVVNYMLMLYQSEVYDILEYSYALHLADILLVGVIMWRIDHQQVLEPLVEESMDESSLAHQTTDAAINTDAAMNTATGRNSRKDIIIYKTGELLRKHCEEAQLYLQRDLSLKTLAQACHTNRTYLSLYFASQGITYYIYINKLRIDHFQMLYREAKKEKGTLFTLQQLSMDSGFSSYNTFSRAFVTCTGTSVSKWLEQVNLEG